MSDKGRLFVIDRIVLWINYLLCIALLISYLAPTVSPQKVWLIQFFGLAYPFLLLSNLLLVLYWPVRQKWLYALLSVICIAIGFNALSNTIGFHPKTKDPIIKDGKVIRVMTYNVHNFKRYGSNNDISTKQQILQIIKDQEPDIIGIQEFYTRKQGVYNMRDSILAIMGTENYYFEPIIFNSSEAIGIAIFSKYPIIGHGILPISDKTSVNACIYIDVQKGDRRLRVYSVHLQSIRFDPEDYKYINGIIGQGKSEGRSPMRIISKLKIAFLKRGVQVEKVKEFVAACPYPYVISGDFNDTPASFAVNEMARGLKNAFREKGSGLGRTYNGSFPNYQIDYIMVNNQFDVLNYTVIEKKLSDHYPVRSDLILK